MPAQLTTHVLDTAHGCPAGGMKLELWSLTGARPALLAATITNAAGRTDAPLLAGARMKPGRYEIIFFVGDYFAAKSSKPARARQTRQLAFLDQVPVRFGIAAAGAKYHVPLLCSPWSYATYRGS